MLTVTIRKIMCDIDFSRLKKCFWKFAKQLPLHIHGYMFKKVIGAGGFSIVCLVVSEQYDKEFVAKVMWKKRQSQRYDHEYLRGLCHTGIIAMYDLFEDDEFVYLICQYCEGGTLADLISGGSLGKSENVLLYYMQRMLQALAYCHDKGVSHRDVKPTNVLIDSYGRPKWIDFGLSVHCAPGEKIEMYDGSGPYKAPEVLLRTPYDPFLADIWSLGVTFYEMATGSLPWSASFRKAMENSILQGMYMIPDTVSPKIAKLIAAMLSVKPEARPTAQQILAMPLFESVKEAYPGISPKSVNPRNFMLKLVSPKPLRSMAKQGATARAEGPMAYKVKR